MGDPETIQPLNRIRPHFEVNLVAQAGALASLRDKDFIPNIRKRNTQAKQHLTQILEQNGFKTLPSSTNFVLGNAGTKERAEEIVLMLREKRIFIRKPGLPPLDHYIRITVGNPQDHEVLSKALKEIVQ